MKNDLNENEVFLKHIIGATNLFSWISQWKILKSYQQNGIHRSIFNFDSLMSQRFMVGIPLNKIKYGNNPFVAFQSSEYSWVSAIIWRKSIICMDEKRLYLISKKVKTIYGDYIPSFAISIEFLSEDILKIFEGKDKISLKHLWFDDELEDENIDLSNYENPNLSSKVKDIILPLAFVSNESEVLTDADLTTELTGDLEILDSLRVSLSIGEKQIKFIKGKDRDLSSEEQDILSSFLKPLDYSKPKIRISVD